MNENQIQQAIRIALGDEPDLVLWRNNIGKPDQWDPNTGQSRKVHYGLPKGSADSVGILTVTVAGQRVGRFFALEFKAPKGRVSDDQTLWLALVRRMGGFAAVVRSVDEAKAALARARNGASE